jgi:hypothetical protein
MGRCVFCRETATRYVKINGRNLYEIDCSVCGKYRVDGIAEARMLGLPAPDDQVLLLSIADANRRGMRYELWSGQEVPLE